MYSKNMRNTKSISICILKEDFFLYLPLPPCVSFSWFSFFTLERFFIYFLFFFFNTAFFIWEIITEQKHQPTHFSLEAAQLIELQPYWDVLIKASKVFRYNQLQGSLPQFHKGSFQAIKRSVG